MIADIFGESGDEEEEEFTVSLVSSLRPTNKSWVKLILGQLMEYWVVVTSQTETVEAATDC